ncbi:hypothetical protein OD91_0241 [Lutibacter sp. Hel_I_33_5]|uniref:hypothetical protein n=1 Tax=Lutibacter sp. Hel_I_33_5 TaxID=1566289 RepID=UPI0011A3C2B8|nr:hypothetical protein [Lutibacter sp. Hel_I_33_5]TVZ55000.1 hypothetical protein OD91_0241 [Lutibacter sp. Hel_I_33_5]
MKTLLTLLILILMPCMLFSQSKEPTKTIDGTYLLMDAERGIGRKMTKEKLFQFTKWGNDKVLVVAACQRCSPAMYKYQKEDSQALGFPVFFNAIGLYMITYDKESFVMIMPANKKSPDWTDFSFSNFYSKSKIKANAMTKQKIKEFIIKISE